MYVLDIEIQNDFEGQVDQQKADAFYRDFMEDIAEEAYKLFVEHIPLGPTGRTLAALSKGDVNKHPGGLWTVSVGVGHVPVGEDEDEDYPLFVHEGTGIFKQGVGRSRDAQNEAIIYPEHGNVMVFEKKGEGTIFTRWVEGQKPQPYLDTVDRELQPYLQLQKRRLAAIMSLLIKIS